MMSLEYTKTEIENMIVGLRGKPYSTRQMKYLYAAVRTRVGQQKFNIEQTVKILYRVIVTQLYPQRKLDKIAENISYQEIEQFIEFTSRLLGNIESLKTIQVPEIGKYNLEFLAEAFVGLGLKRYKTGTLKTKIREYLRNENGNVTQIYDYKSISGSVINGVLLYEYCKVHKVKGLSIYSQDFVQRSQYLRFAISVLNQYKDTIKIASITSEITEEERLIRAVNKIKNNIPIAMSDVDKVRIMCLRFIHKYGKLGFRKLSLEIHPDVCKSKFAGDFQKILNSCYEFSSDGNCVTSEIKNLMNRQQPRKYKRKFHKSQKWQDYIARRRQNGWHSQYYGDASNVILK